MQIAATGHYSVANLSDRIGLNLSVLSGLFCRSPSAALLAVRSFGFSRIRVEQSISSVIRHYGLR